MNNYGEILIYQTEDGKVDLTVTIEKDNIWLSQQSIAALFNVQRAAITKHLKNIFQSGELKENSVSSILEHTAKDGKKYQTKFYQLDAIISIGYRVNSKEATTFRIWATNVLKEYLIKGYAIKQNIEQEKLKELQKTLLFLEKAINRQELSLDESKGLLDIVLNYAKSLIILNQYDSDNLSSSSLQEEVTYEIEYKEAKKVISVLKKELISKKEASELFGNEKDDSFQGILGNVVQSFGGQYLYPSIEEQAAHLLYFIIKNHPFSDGNKRIGAFLFVWFLEKNKHRLKKSGEPKINDNGLVALALLVAQSDPNQKELMVKLIANLINEK